MNAFPDAFTPVSVTVMDEIGPDVPATVMFDCALAEVLSGIAIAVGLEKTVSGIASVSRWPHSARPSLDASAAAWVALAIALPFVAAMGLVTIDSMINRTAGIEKNACAEFNRELGIFFFMISTITEPLPGMGGGQGERKTRAEPLFGKQLLRSARN
jgi:hypothetical protein